MRAVGRGFKSPIPNTNMTTPTNIPRLAVFIDAENVGNPSHLDLVFDKIASASLGTPVVKRVYGNPDLLRSKKWAAACKKHAIDPVQQDRFVSGKNSADVKIVVDAMHLRSRKGKGRIDVFCFVSSDTDFRPLVEYLEQINRTVCGFGKAVTLPALKEVFSGRFFAFEDLLEMRYQRIRDEAATILEGVESHSLGYAALANKLRERLDETIVPSGFSPKVVLKDDPRFDVVQNGNAAKLSKQGLFSFVDRIIREELKDRPGWIPMTTLGVLVRKRIALPKSFRLLPVLKAAPSSFEMRSDGKGTHVRLAENG